MDLCAGRPDGRGAVCAAVAHRSKKLRPANRANHQGTAPVMVISALAAGVVPSYSVPSSHGNGVGSLQFLEREPADRRTELRGRQDDRPWVVTAFRRTLNSVSLLGLVGGVAFVIVAPPIIAFWTHGALHPSEAMCGSRGRCLDGPDGLVQVQFCVALAAPAHRGDRIAAFGLCGSMRSCSGALDWTGRNRDRGGGGLLRHRFVAGFSRSFPTAGFNRSGAAILVAGTNSPDWALGLPSVRAL